MEKLKRYHDACRVCVVQRSAGHQMAALFQTTINTINLSDMFTACTAIILQPNDGLPQLICTVCLSNLVGAYEFQMQCISTDNEIRTVLGYASTDNPQVETTAKLPPAHIEGDESQRTQSIAVKKEEEAIDQQATIYSAGSVPCEHIEKYQKTDMHSDSIEEPIVPTNLDAAEIVAPNRQQHDKESDYELEDTLPLKRKPFANQPPSPSTSTAKRKRDATHRCTICDKTFDKAYRLLRHSSVHKAAGKPYECEICKFRFATESRLIRHKIKHTDLLPSKRENTDGPKSFSCPECAREFAKIESLSSHLKVHKQAGAENRPEDKEFLCEFCPKKFPKVNLLTRHLKIHDEIKANKCNVCDRTFALGAQLIDHMNKHKGVRPHVCPYCNKGFQQSCTLKDHIRTHSGETPFLCSECGKSFNNSSNLRQHLLRHTGVKPFECTECPSRFSCKGGLKSHMVTHTGLKPFVCDICGHSFTKTYSLAKHKRIHTGERPYSCEMCDMRFNSSDHVKRHMRTHTGEKPYKCKYCDRAFAQSNDLVKHTRSHIGDNTYQCTECPAAFRLHSELRTHSKVHFLEQKVTHTVQEPLEEADEQSDTAATMVVITTNTADVEPSHQAVVLSTTIQNDDEAGIMTTTTAPIIGNSQILYIKEEIESITEQQIIHTTNGMQQFTVSGSMPPTATLVVPVTDAETGTILMEHIRIGQ